MTALKPKVTTATIRSDEAAAIQRAEAALTERARLITIAADLPARERAAETVKAEALAAQGKADATAMIAASADRAGWSKVAEAEAAKASEADRQIGRLRAAGDALKELLDAADDEIIAANADLERVSAAASQAACEALSVLSRNVSMLFAPLLQQGHALAAAGVNLANFLAGTTIANPTGRPFIAGHTMTVGEETELLDRTWRDNPEALALFEAHAPRNATLGKIKHQIWRIREDRERALREANKAGRAQAWTNPKPPAAEPRAPYEPPKSTFVPNTDTHNPPAPSTVRDGTLRVDIPTDRTECLSPAEMDAIWSRASGGMPRPAPDAGFIELAGRLPPYRVQNLIEREARGAAMRARYAAASDRLQEQGASGTTAEAAAKA